MFKADWATALGNLASFFARYKYYNDLSKWYSSAVSAGEWIPFW